jgi:hypothetical protein
MNHQQRGFSTIILEVEMRLVTLALFSKTMKVCGYFSIMDLLRHLHHVILLKLLSFMMQSLPIHTLTIWVWLLGYVLTTELVSMEPR